MDEKTGGEFSARLVFNPSSLHRRTACGLSLMLACPDALAGAKGWPRATFARQ